MDMEPFERFESEVRAYCRAFPTVFKRAKGPLLIDENDREYIDFFAGAGALQYGHNPDPLKKRMLEHIERDGVTHGLDMHTDAKREFLNTLQDGLLKPRGLDYKVQFTGPTGTNAVEAALKLARKATGRKGVIAFSHGFHGMTLGALSVTGNVKKRKPAGVPLHDGWSMPFDGFLGEDVDSIDVLERYLDDGSSGIDPPAAFIVEPVQAEGGVNVASKEWLQGLARLADKYCAPLIVDDIQVGCGRTGPFFSFEDAGIEPDMICMSKGVSGYGSPIGTLLIRPVWDVWSPAEHTGTFRGNNPAFATAIEAIRTYWSGDGLRPETERKGRLARERLDAIAKEHADHGVRVRSSGMILGLDLRQGAIADKASKAAFERGLIVEDCGTDGEVLKLLPPLTIDDETLERGLAIIREATAVATGS